MPAYHTVPIALEHQLNPSHIHQHQGGSTPLPRLEDNHSNAFPRQALPLQRSKHLALSRIEPEPHIASGEFVAHHGAGGAPIFKVVGNALCHQRMGVGFRAMGLLLQHLHGKPPLLSAFSLYFLPLAAAALTGDRVVGHLQQSVAPTVFRQHLRQRQRQRRMGFGRNMDWGLCRCVFHDENIG